MERPVLPAPDQIAVDLWKSTAWLKVTSKRSLVYHACITASATLVGFAFGAILGILLAAGIVHVRTLDRSLMPWIIASQTIPILAIAPMIIVILGSIGVTGLVPKAIISMYLCFFPVTIGMVKGLRSPDPLQLDLMRTYNASQWQIFWKLRVPASVPFLFASLKVAIAISLVGAIVGELPTGAAGGLGARLLTGSYYGQTVQIWSALLMAAIARHDHGLCHRRDRMGDAAPLGRARMNPRLAWLSAFLMAAGLALPIGYYEEDLVFWSPVPAVGLFVAFGIAAVVAGERWLRAPGQGRVVGVAGAYRGPDRRGRAVHAADRRAADAAIVGRLRLRRDRRAGDVAWLLAHHAGILLFAWIGDAAHVGSAARAGSMPCWCPRCSASR